MKRRAFFGFMGGAAASGPTLARGLSAEMASAPSASLGQAYGLSGGSVRPDRSWLMQRIASVKKLVAGEDPDAIRHRQMRKLYAIETRDRFRLDSLRSISPSHRHLMFVEGEWHRRDEIDRMNNEYELASLERQLLGI